MTSEVLASLAAVSGTIVTGLVLARRFRAPAIVLASACLAVFAVGTAWLSEWPLGRTAAGAAVLLILLQGSYLAGLMIFRR